MPELNIDKPLSVEGIEKFYATIAGLEPAERSEVFSLIVRELEAASVRATARLTVARAAPATIPAELPALLVGVAKQLQGITKVLVELASKADGANAETARAAIREATEKLA